MIDRAAYRAPGAEHQVPEPPVCCLPAWRPPYDELDALELAELEAACRRRGLGWAIEVHAGPRRDHHGT